VLKTATYDEENDRLTSTDRANHTSTYTYDADKSLTKTTYADQSFTQTNYDAKGGALSSYSYSLGPAGNRLTVAELSGRTVAYGYDALYRLTSETVTADPTGHNGTASYTYDNVGNRTMLSSTLPPAGGASYSYDADDRLASDSYDANGNTVLSGGVSDSYDFENHLTQHGAVTIVYDGDGNRVAETVGGVTTQYLVDTQNPTGYAQVVDELQSGTVTRRYSYGLERISETQSSTTSFYGYDGHGSVRQLFDTAGTITDTYDYDAFGNLINSTGSTPNNYLFAGEQYDPALGLYYNRARYLNTTTGRFWNMDSYEGQARAPGSLHKFLYGLADPVNNSDPSGKQGIAEFSIANSIATTLNNVTSVQGQAIMDQVKYGGNAGLKSLFITGAIIGGAIAIQGFGSIAREVPLLKAGAPGGVVVNELSAEEAAFAEEIVQFRGGNFVGQLVKDTPGIDGWLDEVPASLKVLSTKNPQTVVDRVKEAEIAAAKAQQFGAELFVSAKNINPVDLLNNPDIRAEIETIPRQGTISAVNISTANGWLRFVP
jgi:RHS repeat-associated protein